MTAVDPYEPDSPRSEKDEFIEVKVVLQINRKAWEHEYSIDEGDVGNGYQFEDAVRQWFVGECEQVRENGDWPSIEGITE